MGVLEDPPLPRGHHLHHQTKKNIYFFFFFWGGGQEVSIKTDKEKCILLCFLGFPNIRYKIKISDDVTSCIHRTLIIIFPPFIFSLHNKDAPDLVPVGDSD